VPEQEQVCIAPLVRGRLSRRPPSFEGSSTSDSAILYYRIAIIAMAVGFILQLVDLLAA